MKKLASTLLCALLLTGMLAACDDEPSEDEVEETTELDEALEEEEVVEEDEEIEGEEVVHEESDKALEGGQWVESALYELKFRVPDDWEIGDSGDVVSATDSDGSTTALIAGSESDRTLQASINNLKDELQFTDVELESSDPTTVNGFPGHRGGGSAVLVKDDDIDTEIEFIGYALRVGEHNITLMIFSEATMYEAKRDTIDGIAHTLARME